MFRKWWAKASLVGLQARSYPDSFYATSHLYPEYVDAERDVCPLLQPYDGLAEIWHEYTSPRQWDYSKFLRALSKTHEGKIPAVLDLACGTGS